MPNWCANHLELMHENPRMLKRAEKALHEGNFLNEFVPMPPALDGTAPAEPDVAEKNIKATGYSDWYSFAVGEWGTKWDVTDESASIEDGVLEANFDSAWSPPIEGLMKLEKLGFTVNLKYYEPGMGFVGEYTSHDGESTYNIDVAPEELLEYWGHEEWDEEEEEENDSN